MLVNIDQPDQKGGKRGLIVVLQCMYKEEHIFVTFLITNVLNVHFCRNLHTVPFFVLQFIVCNCFEIIFVVLEMVIMNHTL